MSEAVTIKTPEKLVYKRKISKSKRIRLWIKRLFLWFAILVILFPVFSIVASSLSKGTSFAQNKLIPDSITLENYKVALTQENGFLTWMKNTLFVATFVSLVQLAMTLPAAYAFSRLKFTGKRNGLMALLILQMFPNSMMVPAILSVAYKLPFGMDNLIFLSVVLCGGSAYNIWLMEGYIDGLPKDLDEAAMVDGATNWQIFTKIILPLTKSMAVVVFFFSFIGIFGEFIFSAALLKDQELTTLVVGLKTLMTQNMTIWPQYAADSVLASVPLAILFVSIQKFMAKGLVAGAVKE